ncbi:DUF2735 domain-containing protein [Rhizobium deserti]|uniref:DUF2735 domain-containing protein n=1 Tax=Rhizobium deserti TaxID=2547961 RepID=A0A4R5UMQ3_9HYPH|nr:DUF2735 domain-containing protein [Rhizobium deserti]TDK39165.1 DUF2735 domain-containing protein [Rhizobium deserti]
MTIDMHRETATILQFPLQPRLRLEGGKTIAGGYERAVVVVDTCWYHEEAVRDATPKPERPKPC